MNTFISIYEYNRLNYRATCCITMFSTPGHCLPCRSLIILSYLPWRAPLTFARNVRDNAYTLVIMVTLACNRLCVIPCFIIPPACYVTKRLCWHQNSFIQYLIILPDFLEKVFLISALSHSGTLPDCDSEIMRIFRETLLSVLMPILQLNNASKTQTVFTEFLGFNYSTSSLKSCFEINSTFFYRLF
jgi:hypothetical protein